MLEEQWYLQDIGVGRFRILREGQGLEYGGGGGGQEGGANSQQAHDVDVMCPLVF